MSIIAKANRFSKRHLGTIGRPVAVAGAAGVGTYLVAPKLGVEALTGVGPAVAVGVGAAAAVEGIFYFWGQPTPEMRVENLIDSARENIPPEAFKALAGLATADNLASLNQLAQALPMAAAAAQAETAQQQQAEPEVLPPAKAKKQA